VRPPRKRAQSRSGRDGAMGGDSALWNAVQRFVFFHSFGVDAIYPERR